MAYLLIVEDDELLRDALGSLLQQAGHRVAMAEDGALALEQLANDDFEGVVLDLGLPKVDGLSVLRSLRLRHPALPVLILTARDGVEDRVAGLNAGADDYLTKPFNRDELQARLQAMLRRASLPAFGQASATRVGDSTPLLRLDQVNTFYGPIHILQDVNIEIFEGEIVCLLGGNASGKSTTLKTVLGIVKPVSG
ncbi:response regulator, partial [Hydrogenophaga sp.]|uniref:response regulator n=1 Tax=Hydrogenophaga sp. TaxID=1904254 RepID=UPI00356851D1